MVILHVCTLPGNFYYFQIYFSAQFQRLSHFYGDANEGDARSTTAVNAQNDTAVLLLTHGQLKHGKSIVSVSSNEVTQRSYAVVSCLRLMTTGDNAAATVMTTTTLLILLVKSIFTPPAAE